MTAGSAAAGPGAGGGPVRVRVLVPGALSDLAGGHREIDLAVRAGATLAEVLDALAEHWPALAYRIRDEAGALRRHVNVFIGTDNARDLGGLAAAVPPGGRVQVLPAVSGG